MGRMRRMHNLSFSGVILSLLLAVAGAISWRPQRSNGGMLAFAHALPLSQVVEKRLSQCTAIRMKGGSGMEGGEGSEAARGAGAVGQGKDDLWNKGGYVSAGRKSLVSRRPKLTEANMPSKEWCLKRLNSFDARDYHAPWYMQNPHVNTIVGALFATPQPPPYRREIFDTPDGDFFTVDFLDSRDKRRAPRGLVFLYHGLEANSLSPLTVRQAWSLAEAGFDVASISFRGCSGEENLRPGGYHMGFTDDVRQLAKEMHQRDPSRRMYVTGTSLGGNVMTKLLGELGDDAARYGILGGAVACVPTSDNSVIDGDKFAREVYSANFLKSIIPKAEKQWAKFGEAFPKEFEIDRVRNASTIGEIDDYYISAIYGFEDRFDYYERNICVGWLSQIQVPLFMVNARDDPFFDVNALPTKDDVRDGTVRLVETQHGGHCGYVDGLDSLSLGSIPGVIARIATGRKGEMEPSGKGAPNGWLPDEMTRFLVHLDDAYDNREFGRTEQISTVFEAEEELRDRCGTLEVHAKELQMERQRLEKEKSDLLAEKAQQEERMSAKQALMQRLEAIYNEAEVRASREINSALTSFLKNDNQRRLTSEAGDAIQAVDGVQREAGGSSQLSRIIAETLVTKVSSPMSPTKPATSPDQATLASAVLARMDALNAVCERLNLSNGDGSGGRISPEVVKQLLEDGATPPPPPGSPPPFSGEDAAFQGA